MPLSLSPTLAHSQSATLAINERVRTLEADGRPVVHMGFGESRFPVHPKILEAFRAHATDREYPPVRGYSALLEAIAHFHRREFALDVAPEQAIVGPGSKSLIFAAVRALDGDLLLPSPSWVSYQPQAEMLGRQVAWVETQPEETYCLTGEGLLRGLHRARSEGMNPRILILNSPCNPTGVTYPRRFLAEIADVARANDIAVISDEIYALLTFSDQVHHSIAHEYPEGTIVTGGVSKHLSLGGWRLGMALVPPGKPGAMLMEALAAVAGHIWSSPSAPVQRAATVAYSDDPDIMAYVRQCTAIHEVVTRAMYDQLRAASIPCPTPSGAYYLYPSFNPWREALQEQHGISTSQELASLLLEEFGIATLPGTAFGAPADELTLRLATSHLYARGNLPIERTVADFQAEPDTAQFLTQHCASLFEVGQRFAHFVAALER